MRGKHKSSKRKNYICIEKPKKKSSMIGEALDILLEFFEIIIDFLDI